MLQAYLVHAIAWNRVDDMLHTAHKLLQHRGLVHCAQLVLVAQNGSQGGAQFSLGSNQSYTVSAAWEHRFDDGEKRRMR